MANKSLVSITDYSKEKILQILDKAAEFEKNHPQVPLVHEGWIFNGYEIDASLIK